MYPATCSECGKSCEVPFKPSGDKPVYCNDCFKKIRGGGKKDSGQFGKGVSPQPKPSDHSHKEHAQIHAKLDQILKMLQSMDLPKALPKAEAEVKTEEEKKPAKKTTAKKTTVKKTATKKTTAKKTTAKKAAKKK